VRAFGGVVPAATEFAAFYQQLGAPLLQFLQQLTVTLGGRATPVPANIAFGVFLANGEAGTIDGLSRMISATSSRPKVLGALLGRVISGLNAPDVIALAAANLDNIVAVVNAAVNSQSVPFFDFSTLSSTAFDIVGAAKIIVTAVKANNYF